MPATWMFVDQPTASPTVLLDMNNGDTWRMSSEEFDVSPPPLRRSIVSNQMNDGGMLTAASYELRELKFTVQLHGANEAARIAQLKAFEAELAKPANLLMFRPQRASSPVFFRTLRSDNFVLDTQFAPGQAWKITASILAEPFAIGTRVDLASVTVTNNPASGTNPTRWDITGIVGDAATPAFVRIANLGAGGTVMLAQRTVNNPTALTNFVQAEAGTMGTDTTATAGGATFSGTSNNAATTTFATNSLNVIRLTSTVPTASSPDALRGRYRVMLRAFLSGSATASTYVIRWETSGTDAAAGPLVTQSMTPGQFRLIDLGILELPHATTAPTTIGYSGLTPGTTAPDLRLRSERTAGNGSLDMDYLYLLPADERLCAAQQVASSGFLVLDGPNDATYAMAAGTTPFGAAPSNRLIDNAGGLVPSIGGLPMLVPGTTNRWYMLTNLAVTDTKAVEVSYWPRWREVAA